jgi:hypothetical protein
LTSRNGQDQYGTYLGVAESPAPGPLLFDFAVATIERFLGN